MKIHPVGTFLFHADGQTNNHDQAKAQISHCCPHVK